MKHIVQFVVCRLFVLGEITTGCGPSIPSLRGKYAVGINSSITECFFFFFFPWANNTAIKMTKPRQTTSVSLSIP